MNPKIKTAWLTRLASNAFACSGNGRLRTLPALGVRTSYSSLGVLRELAIEAGVKAHDISDTDIALCPAVAKWADMDALPWMKLEEPSGIFNLAYINKLGGGSFGLAIAAIETNL